ncbi:hypothetical protein U1Q18_042404 [Sarracenia purpurea var. burkii]
MPPNSGQMPYGSFPPMPAPLLMGPDKVVNLSDGRGISISPSSPFGRQYGQHASRINQSDGCGGGCGSRSRRSSSQTRSGRASATPTAAATPAPYKSTAATTSHQQQPQPEKYAKSKRLKCTSPVKLKDRGIDTHSMPSALPSGHIGPGIGSKNDPATTNRGRRIRKNITIRMIVSIKKVISNNR